MKAKMTMHHRFPSRWGSIAVVVGLLTGMLTWPTAGVAQLLTSTTETLTGTTETITGQAVAVRSNVLGTTTALADTGTLGGSTDAREASALTGEVPSLLTGDVLHATTIGWPDQVASEASLADLVLSVAGNTIGADLVMAEATAILGGGAVGTSTLDNLSINGMPIAVTGEPNQTIDLVGGQVVINQQSTSAGGIVVNALRVIVDGVADVVVGSATAGIQ